jgi:hypothetical protein
VLAAEREGQPELGIDALRAGHRQWIAVPHRRHRSGYAAPMGNGRGVASLIDSAMVGRLKMSYKPQSHYPGGAPVRAEPPPIRRHPDMHIIIGLVGMLAATK